MDAVFPIPEPNAEVPNVPPPPPPPPLEPAAPNADWPNVVPLDNVDGAPNALFDVGAPKALPDVDGAANPELCAGAPNADAFEVDPTGVPAPNADGLLPNALAPNALDPNPPEDEEGWPNEEDPKDVG